MKETKLLCPKCDKEIGKDDKKFMVAVDKPYANIYFHKACYTRLGGKMLDFLQKNIEKWYN